MNNFKTSAVVMALAAAAAAMLSGCQQIADLTGYHVPGIAYKNKEPEVSQSTYTKVPEPTTDASVPDDVETYAEKAYREDAASQIAQTGFTSTVLVEERGNPVFLTDKVLSDVYVSKCYFVSPLPGSCREGRARIRGLAQGLERNCNLGNGDSCFQLGLLLGRATLVIEALKFLQPQDVVEDRVLNDAATREKFIQYLGFNNSMFGDNYLYEKRIPGTDLVPKEKIDEINFRACNATISNGTACFKLGTENKELPIQTRFALIQKSAQTSPIGSAYLAQLYLGVSKEFAIFRDPGKFQYYKENAVRL